MSTPAPNEAITGLAEILGEDATREIVRLYLDELPQAFRRLPAASREEQVRIVHGLKSSSLHMGAQDLCNRVAELEDRLARQGRELEPADLPALQADFEAVAPALRTYAAQKG